MHTGARDCNSIIDQVSTGRIQSQPDHQVPVLTNRGGACLWVSSKISDVGQTHRF